MGWSDFLEPEVVVTRGIAESRRFGVDVLHVRTGALNEVPLAVRSSLRMENYGLAVLRFPTTNLFMGDFVSHLSHRTIYTDPTVYWMSSQLDRQEIALSPDVFVEKVSSQSNEEVLMVIADSFKKYRAHWHYNPLTNHVDMADAYSEWARAAWKNPKFDYFVLKTHLEEKPIGIAMTELENDVLEIHLAGIASEYQGQGFYGVLLHGVEEQAKAMGATAIVISTQVGNLNVQKAWLKQGWTPKATVHCVHVLGGQV